MRASAVPQQLKKFHFFQQTSSFYFISFCFFPSVSCVCVCPSLSFHGNNNDNLRCYSHQSAQHIGWRLAITPVPLSIDSKKFVVDSLVEHFHTEFLLNIIQTYSIFCVAVHSTTSAAVRFPPLCI